MNPEFFRDFFMEIVFMVLFKKIYFKNIFFSLGKANGYWVFYFLTIFSQFNVGFFRKNC